MSERSTQIAVPTVQTPPTARPGLALPVAVVHSLRPKQWTKNLLVFAGLTFTYNLGNEAMLAATLGAFAVFCALSSAG